MKKIEKFVGLNLTLKGMSTLKGGERTGRNPQTGKEIKIAK